MPKRLVGDPIPVSGLFKAPKSVWLVVQVVPGKYLFNDSKTLEPDP